MITIVLIFLGVAAASATFAFVGARIGAKMEEKSLGSGVTEESMKSGLFSASLIGALLGSIPVLVFVGVLLAMAATSAPPAGHGDDAAPAATP